MSRGVLAGAAKAFQDAAYKVLTPASLAVGTCGNAAARLSPVTAKARNAWPLICGNTGARISTPTSIWPPRKAVKTAGVPLKGTTCASMPAVDLNSSAAKCCVLPTLMLPMLSLPGLALAKASKSAKLANLDSWGTTIAMSKVPRTDKGMRSFSAS